MISDEWWALASADDCEHEAACLRSQGREAEAKVYDEKARQWRAQARRIAKSETVAR